MPFEVLALLVIVAVVAMIAWLISLRSNEAHTAAHYFAEGTDHLNRGHDEKAFESYGKALELDPKCVSAYVNRSVIYAGWSQFQNALEDCERALSIAPSNTNAMINKAFALRSMGKQQDAIKVCNKVLELANTNGMARSSAAALAYCNRGYSHFLLNETEEALRDAQLSVDCSVDSGYTAKMISLRAKFLAHTGRVQEAMKLCNQAVTMSDKNETEYPWRYARSTRALVSAMCGDYLDAMKDVDHVLERHPKFAYAILVKARILLMKNALNEALAAVNGAIELNPLDPECFSVRFLIREKQGDVNAEKDAIRARELGFLRSEFV